MFPETQTQYGLKGLTKGLGLWSCCSQKSYAMGHVDTCGQYCHWGHVDWPVLPPVTILMSVSYAAPKGHVVVCDPAASSGHVGFHAPGYN